jgi:hypothetical protein
MASQRFYVPTATGPIFRADLEETPVVTSVYDQNVTDNRPPVLLVDLGIVKSRVNVLKALFPHTPVKAGITRELDFPFADFSAFVQLDNAVSQTAPQPDYTIVLGVEGSQVCISPITFALVEWVSAQGQLGMSVRQAVIDAIGKVAKAHEVLSPNESGL